MDIKKLFSDVLIEDEPGNKYRDDVGYVIYTFSNPRVSVTAKADVPREAIHQAVLNRLKLIERHERQAKEARVIDIADAHLIKKFSFQEHLQALEQATLDPANIHVYGKGENITEKFSETIKVMRMDGGFRLSLMGKQIWFSADTMQETWSNGKLTTGGLLDLPKSVLISLNGQKFDDLVQGSMMNGADLVINKAWEAVGRLNMNFVKNTLKVSDFLKNQT